MESIEKIRREIDEVDARIAKEMKKRFEIVKKLGRIKTENYFDIEDDLREKEVYENYRRELGNFADFADELAKAIINYSKKIQRQIFEEARKK